MQATTDIDYKVLYEELLLANSVLKHRLDQLEKMIFGSRQERFVAPAPTQMSLDIQAQTVATVTLTDTKQIAYTRAEVSVEKKPLVHPGRGKLPDHLRREDIVIEPTDVPDGSRKIGELITEQLECTPHGAVCKKIYPSQICIR